MPTGPHPDATTAPETDDPIDVKTLVVLNDPAYGSEGSDNGLRPANALAKRDEEVRIFLLADAASDAAPWEQSHRQPRYPYSCPA